MAKKLKPAEFGEPVTYEAASSTHRVRKPCLDLVGTPVKMGDIIVGSEITRIFGYNRNQVHFATPSFGIVCGDTPQYVRWFRGCGARTRYEVRHFVKYIQLCLVVPLNVVLANKEWIKKVDELTGTIHRFSTCTVHYPVLEQFKNMWEAAVGDRDAKTVRV